jgi:hypothetical protein
MAERKSEASSDSPFLQSCNPAILQLCHSHSIVDGGFELMS